MKFTILVGALALAATAFTPLAHASAALGGLDKQCYNTLRKEWSGCNKGSGSGAKSPDFKFNMKSHDKPNDNSDNGVNDISDDPDTGGEDPGTDDDGDNGGDDGDDNGGGNDDGDNGHGNDEDGNDDSNPGNSNDAGTDNTDTGASNNSPPQSNSNDIKGFDPSSGLYGPGT